MKLDESITQMNNKEKSLKFYQDNYTHINKE